MTVEIEHPEFRARADEWQTLRDVLAGSRAVKVAGERYLPSLDGQTTMVMSGGTTAYDAYKQRAKFYAATARTQQALVGTVFHKDLVVKAPADLEAQLKDLTLADTPVEDFAVQALSEVVGMGRYGILVDMPAEDPVGPARNRVAARPYWVGYRTEQIINWREVSANGDTVLTLVVLKESYEVSVNDFETKKEDQYRVLQLIQDTRVPVTEGGRAYTQTIWRKPTKESKEFVPGDPVVPLKLGKPLTFIPFLVIGPTSLSPCPEKPPLSEMAEINLHMYRRSADLEHGRHFTGLPQPVVTGLAPTNSKREPLRIGSAEAWTLPAGATAEYLEFTGQGLSSLVEGMKEDKEEMAELGAEMFAAEPDTGNQETATAVRVRHSSKTASLKTIARRLGSGLTKCLRWHAWWLGASQDVADEKILATVNTTYIDIKMTPEELKAWVLALQAGSVAYATFYAQLERGELSRPGVTSEEEQAEIGTEAADAAASAADAAGLMAEAVPPAPVVVPGKKPPEAA